MTLILNPNAVSRRPLGCRFARDPRDYPLARRLSELDWRSVPERTRRWRHGPILDQGQTSECTRYSLAARRGAAPICISDPLSEVTEAYYHWAVENDEFPGNDLDEGTSVRAMCQAGRYFGLLTAFYASSTLLTIVRYVRRFGPINLGTEWTDAMFTPDAHNFVTPIGGVAGGHAYCLLWVYRAHKDKEVSDDDTALCQNSWGDSFADHGLFKIRGGDLRELIEDRGGEGWEVTEAPKPKAAA